MEDYLENLKKELKKQKEKDELISKLMKEEQEKMGTEEGLKISARIAELSGVPEDKIIRSIDDLDKRFGKKAE